MLEALAVQPFKLVDFLHRWPEEDSHDWDNEKKVVVTGKSVCNWLIHSYMFFVVFNEDNVIYSFPGLKYMTLLISTCLSLLDLTVPKELSSTMNCWSRKRLVIES